MISLHNNELTLGPEADCFVWITQWLGKLTLAFLSLSLHHAS